MQLSAEGRAFESRLPQYVHYSNAWWANLLNLTSGEFGPSMHGGTTKPLKQLPDLSGRYHDGHTRCDGPAGAACRGFLEATYTYSMVSAYEGV